MPLADMHGVIAGKLQHFRQRDLRRRQTLILVRNLPVGRSIDPQHIVRPRAVVVEQLQHPAHAVGRRRELESGARAIAARHQHRA